MTEKKAATKKVVTSKAATSKKSAAKKNEVVINAENVGFRAGDVYQALADAEKPLSVPDLAKAATIRREEAFLVLNWLINEERVNINREL